MNNARVLRSFVEVRAGEARLLWLSFLSHFLVLASYYVIRPIRDEMAVAGGVENLPWMFTATLAAMLVANALFSALVARFSRRRFIPLAYRFFLGNLLLFFVLLRFLPTANAQLWVGRVFYVWTNVFNLFVVSVFWAFVTDVFDPRQARRLFGFISVGGTLGAIAGAATTATLVSRTGTLPLLLIAAALLELSVRCVQAFPNVTSTPVAGHVRTAAAEAPVGGGVWSGIAHDLRSPYLLGIAGYVLLYSVTSTVLYVQQAELAAKHFADPAARTAFFAQLDFAVNVVTIFGQVFLAGRALEKLGVGPTLALLPAFSVVGFATFGCAPTLAVFVGFQAVRRAANFALARPAREVLFTVLSREDKYKARSFLDTFIYRAGDGLGAWSFPALGGGFGLGMAGMAWVAVPLALVWCALSVWLGREQNARQIS